MFQWISILGFAGLLAGILLHWLLFPCGYKPGFTVGTLARKMVHLFTLLFPKQKLGWLSVIRKLVFLLGLFSFFVLLVTGFGPLTMGMRLQGYWLMIHATFAPVFIGCVAIVAIMGAGQYCFNKKDTENIQWTCRTNRDQGCWLTDTGLGAKAVFWFLLLMSLPLTLSMVLSMFPLFGTNGQEFLLQLHRVCALVFSLALILEIYMLIRMEVIKDMRN